MSGWTRRGDKKIEFWKSSLPLKYLITERLRGLLQPNKFCDLRVALQRCRFDCHEQSHEELPPCFQFYWAAFKYIVSTHLGSLRMGGWRSFSLTLSILPLQHGHRTELPLKTSVIIFTSLTGKRMFHQLTYQPLYKCSLLCHDSLLICGLFRDVPMQESERLFKKMLLT